MGQLSLSESLHALQEQFDTLDWTYHDLPGKGHSEKMYRWPGDPKEAILICVHKSSGVQELFHRHDFFFFNYTYQGQYDSLSYKYDNLITIREKELYAGQPFAGHALCVHDNQETIVVGVLIQKETFFRSFLPLLTANSKLFHFFLDPSTNSFSEEYLHLKIEDSCTIQTLLEMMVIEYANKREDTQDVLGPLALSFLTQVARQSAEASRERKPERLCDRILLYISEHFDTVTLKELGERFSYHPNYISTLLTRELGKSFSQLLLEQRMERAVILLGGTTLSVNEIALLLGYTNSSNFYKAFRAFYGMSPRQFENNRADAFALKG